MEVCVWRFALYLWAFLLSTFCIAPHTCKDHIIKTHGDFALRNHKTTKNKNGIEFHSLYFFGTHGKLTIEYEQVCWVEKDLAYLIVFSSAQNEYLRYRPVAERIMTTISYDPTRLFQYYDVKIK